MVRQYRYTVSSLSLEFPMGYAAGKSPRETAEIELVEETGIKAKKLTELGKFWLSCGRSNQEAYVYLAEELTFDKPKPEEGEFMETEEYSMADINLMIDEGVILDGPSIVAFHFLEKHMKE